MTRTLPLPLELSEQAAFALRKLAGVQAVGNHKNENTYTPRDCARDILEVEVLTRFYDAFGMTVGEYRRKYQR